MTVLFATLSHDDFTRISEALLEGALSVDRAQSYWIGQLQRAYFSVIEAVGARLREQAPWGLLFGSEENRIRKIELELSGVEWDAIRWGSAMTGIEIKTRIAQVTEAPD